MPPTKVEAPRAQASPLMSVAYVLQTLAELKTPDDIVVEEAPSARPVMQAYLPITRSETFYTMDSGGLGYGMPAAVGIALGKPDSRVICLMGDGSSMYSIQGLWSAAQHALQIAFVIVKNGTYEALNEFGRHFQMSQLPGVQLPQLDFCGLARSQGVQAVSVTSIEKLDDALLGAFRADAPMLVEVAVEQ